MLICQSVVPENPVAKRDDVGHTVANNQVVNTSLLLPPDDDDRPDVHREGDHREGDVAKRYMGSFGWFMAAVLVTFSVN